MGRGTWGRSQLVKDDKGRTAVLKTPLRAEDFAGEPDAEVLSVACANCAVEQIEWLEKRPHAHKPRLLATVELRDGRRGYLLPRYPRSLLPVAQGAESLEDVIETVVAVAEALEATARIHGNLRPTNVLFGQEREIVLADLATPAIRSVRNRLVELAGVAGWTPPEAEGRAHASWDTWALGQVLHAACHALPGVDPPPPPRLADRGLDRDGVKSLVQRVLTRLGDEHTNPRFRDRVADRMSALLSRALSALAEPSPPYRFHDMEAFGARVRKVQALVHPRVEEVGRILFPGHADDGVFRGTDSVDFTVTVACTRGVSDLEDMICGVQLLDLDHPDHARVPVQDLGCEVQVHRSGRLRFRLSLPDVAPGRYRIRAAFAVRDSGDPPVVASTDLEVRPPPGYVPPHLDVPPTPLSFPVRPIAETSPDASPTPQPPPTRWTAPPPPELIDEDAAELIDDVPEVPAVPTVPPPSSALPPLYDDDEPDLVEIDEEEPELIDDVGPEEQVLAPLTPFPSARAVPLHAVEPPPEPLPELRPVELVANVGEDLPSWGAKPETQRSNWLYRLAETARNDSTRAVGMAIVSSVVLVVAVSLLARAC